MTLISGSQWLGWVKGVLRWQARGMGIINVVYTCVGVDVEMMYSPCFSTGSGVEPLSLKSLDLSTLSFGLYHGNK